MNAIKQFLCVYVCVTSGSRVSGLVVKATDCHYGNLSLVAMETCTIHCSARNGICSELVKCFQTQLS